MAVAIQIISLGPLVAEIGRDFQLGLAQSGKMLSVNSLFFMLAVLLSALVARYIPRKHVNTFGFLAGGLSMLMMNFASGYGAVLLVIGISGGCVGTLENSVTATADSLDEANATFNVNLLQGFFGIGAMAGPLLVSFLVVAGHSWRTMYTVMGIIYLAMGVLLLFSFRNVDTPPERHKKRRPGSLKAMFTDWRFWLGCLAMFCYCGAEGSAWGWMSSFMQEAQNLSVVGAAAAVAVFWLGMTIGRFATSWLTRRYGTAQLCTVLAIFSFVVTIASALVDHPLLSWIFAFLMGLAYSGQWSLIITNGTARYRDNMSLATALFIAMGSAGIAVITTLAGYVAERFGVRAAMGSPALLFLVVIAATLALAKSDAADAAKAKK